MAIMPLRLGYLCAGSLLLLAACATQQRAPASATGDASWAMKAPAASQRYKLAIGDAATGTELAASVTPVYPAGLLSACPPPQELQVLVIVDKAGNVSGVRIADDAQAGEPRRSFALATRKAVMQWRFNPLQVQHDGFDAAGNQVVISEARPFSLTYLFRFACHDGNATVTGNETAANRS